MSEAKTIAPTPSPTVATSGSRRQAPPAIMTIFGAGGDLTKRLVMPALYNLVRAGRLPDGFSIIGVDIADQTTETWRNSLAEMMQAFMRSGPAQSMGKPGRGSRTECGTCEEILPNQKLLVGSAKILEERERQDNTANVLFYLATADRFFGPVIDQLGRAGLTRQSDHAWRRVIIEKPFGHDLASAKALNAQILKVLSEDQIYRIDHFLGKETVQNILVLRFANGIFEPLWNRDHIDHVQITAAETVGVEHRGRFYEQTGALRDMVPNHLFQLLAMIAHGAADLIRCANAVRTKKTELLQAIHPVSPNDAVRGQYGAGVMIGGKRRGLSARAQRGARFQNRNLCRAQARNRQLALGRRSLLSAHRQTSLPPARPKLRCSFARRLMRCFATPRLSACLPNILLLRIQPDEGLSISFSAKRPGAGDQDRRRCNGLCLQRLFRPARVGRLRDADL